MKIVKTILIIFAVFSGNVTSSLAQEDCTEVYDEICENRPNLNIAEFTQCLKKNFNALPKECQPSAQEQIKKYGEYGDKCRKDVKKLCGYDLNRMFPPDQKKAQKIYNCLIANWKKLNEGCQAYVRVSIPFFPIIEEGLQEQEWVDLRQNPKKKVKIAGTNKTVSSVLQEGDVIWYEAKLIAKKVVEQYPFCPPVKEKGLEPIVLENSGRCVYQVKTSWGEELLLELKESQQLKKLTHMGFRGTLLENDADLMQIINKYPFCPNGFQLEVKNDTYRNTQRVSCTIIARFDCPLGWVYSSFQGFFGCQRLAQCNAMNPSYQDFDHQKYCAECFSGGCLDLKKSQNYTDDPQMYCRINYKDPSLTTCEN